MDIEDAFLWVFVGRGQVALFTLVQLVLVLALVLVRARASECCLRLWRSGCCAAGPAVVLPVAGLTFAELPVAGGCAVRRRGEQMDIRLGDGRR